jgi:putative transposase
MSKKYTRRLSIGPLDKIVIKGREMRWESSDEFGHILFAAHSIGAPVSEGFTHDMLEEFDQADQFEFDPGYHSEQRIRARWMSGGTDYLYNLDPSDQKIILQRQEVCDEILKIEATDPQFKRTDKMIKAAIAKIHPTIVARELARNTGDKLVRCDQPFEIKPAPCARTVRRWLSSYEDGGFDPLALRDGHYLSGNAYSGLDPAVIRVMTQRAAEYASRLKPTLAKQYRFVCSDIVTLNSSRVDPLDTPAKSTFRNFVKKMPSIQVYAGRNGPAAAQRKFFIVGEGPDVVRAGQRVFFDGHKANLLTLVPVQESLPFLSDAAVKKFEKERLVIHAGLDLASRCVVAARIARTENKEAAHATLRMAVSDKSAYALAAGCKSDWPMRVRPGIIETDTGPAWHSELFRAAATNLRSTIRNAPVGMPMLRGAGERWFGTTSLDFLSDFSGRTFANIDEKGDYEADKELSMMSEEFGPLLVRWIVDKYHHRPHAALNNMSPYDKWEELQRYGIVPAPNADQIRAIFGVTLERALDQRGVRVMGIHYQSEAIQAYRRHFGDVRVTIKMDPEDLGKVSIWLDKEWHPVPAMRGNFKGVRLDVWLETMRDLRRRNLIKTKLSEHIVNAAMHDLAQAGRRFMARADIADPVISPAEVEHLERTLMVGFDIEGDDPADNDRAPDGPRDPFGSAIRVVGTGKAVDGTSAPDPAPDGSGPKAPRKPRRKLEDRK